MEGLTEEDREMAAALAEAGAVRAVHDTLDTPKVSANPYAVSRGLCRSINDWLRKNEDNYHAAAEHFSLSRGTIKRHADSHENRECEHGAAGIDPRRCSVMREMARDGFSQRELGDRFDVSHGTARYHITGECSCEHSVPPAEYDFEGSRKVGRRECELLRNLAGSGVPHAELGDDIGLDLSRRCAGKHVRGNCSHD